MSSLGRGGRRRACPIGGLDTIRFAARSASAYRAPPPLRSRADSAFHDSSCRQRRLEPGRPPRARRRPLYEAFRQGRAEPASRARKSVCGLCHLAAGGSERASVLAAAVELLEGALLADAPPSLGAADGPSAPADRKATAGHGDLVRVFPTPALIEKLPAGARGRTGRDTVHGPAGCVRGAPGAACFPEGRGAGDAHRQPHAPK